MFLKKIEMQGFKSFADKTKIEFDKGVTAVVGPNGSGKSNITESLRWALGESSAKSLRGGKMPDVIFSGTESRKALNFAQVIVTLDNSDGFIKDAKEEIRVERHIYRNGDSDYLIDGKKVRLRDIHDLFLDTGLGRDSFSIISQGRVEEIFNSKPEERRAIFEEAAGVLKYKTRKKETQTKLNQTQDNLDRLDDIIYELEMQVKPLEKQAQTAKEFLVLEDKRKQLQLDILVEDIRNDKSKLSKENDDLASAKEQLSTYYEQRQRLEEKNQKLKDKRHSLSEEIAKKQGTLVDLTRLISETEGKIDVIRLQSSQSEEKKQEAKRRLQDLINQKEELELELETKRQNLVQMEQRLSQTQEKILKIEEELALFSTDPDQIIENLREEFVSLMQKEAELSNNLTMLISEMENQKQLSENQTAELVHLEEQLNSLKYSGQEALEKYESAKADLIKLRQDYQNLYHEVRQSEESYQTQQTKMFDVMDDIKSKEARKNSLEAILKSHSNFYVGVKSVLQASQQIGGLIGAVSEHLTFDRNYQTALEIALGGSAQHVIVEDEAAAKRSIAYLKQNRQGRATFLPLTTIKARQLSSQNQSKLETSPGFLGLASDLVSFEPRLESIFKNLLGVTAIFDTIDNANKAARALNYQVRLVTLDGTELRPGGSFSGGANRQNNTTFIKPELDSINVELEKAREDLRQQEVEVSSLQERLKEQQSQLESLKNQGESAGLAEQKAELEYQQIADRLTDLTKVYQGLKASSSSADSSDFDSRRNALENQLEQIGIQKEKVTAEIDKIKADKDSINLKVTELNNQLSHAKLQERDLLSEKKFEHSNQTRLEINLSQTKTEIDQLEELLIAQAENLTIQELPTLEKQLDEAISRKSADEERLIQLRFELEDCEAALDDVTEQVQKASQQNESLIRQQAQHEAEIDKLSDRLRDHSRLLSEDYSVTFEEAEEIANILEDILESRQELQNLRRQIRALGPVNLDAIEQYDEVNDRLIFLNGQKEDLVHAKNLLLETINDMDEEVKSRFRVTFEAIRESFKLTFTQMFGGGAADLYLTEGDLLNAGVEISVQPPGKKIQSLNLMSGGEKALSALALLFAIIRVKTIPFVILDEVEAALDEANVKRFGDYLNRFDKSSQFIVVTHRKGTMAAADSIYGVTMQESGVSKIVSVKLKDAESLVN
ncbi:condensin subunit Smc [Streptococcus henryi]|uniref:Chromosome partition protein Smc n=1 Tax=Streptococcus henryi TaxID=439219 RepID=A0A1G6BZZ6_9STRE|nr:chromosome segregation protein SMC [Streptococcus henryi]SDB26148.1 condensin subunit Smc [Streptococcus henryi]